MTVTMRKTADESPATPADRRQIIREAADAIEAGKPPSVKHAQDIAMILRGIADTLPGELLETQIAPDDIQTKLAGILRRMGLSNDEAAERANSIAAARPGLEQGWQEKRTGKRKERVNPIITKAEKVLALAIEANDLYKKLPTHDRALFSLDGKSGLKKFITDAVAATQMPGIAKRPNKPLSEYVAGEVLKAWRSTGREATLSKNDGGFISYLEEIFDAMSIEDSAPNQARRIIR